MLKKLMLLSIVMLTVGGSLQAMSESEEVKSLQARRKVARASERAGGTKSAAYRDLVDALGSLEDVVTARDTLLAIYGHIPTGDADIDEMKAKLDIEIDELRSKIDQAEAAVLVAE